MKTIQANASPRTKKVLVNPHIVGNNIHYNKTKYTVASSHFGVKESSASQAADKVHYNPRFFAQSVPKQENVHINPHYLVTNSTPSQTSGQSIGNFVHVNPQFLSSTSSFTSHLTYSSAFAAPPNVNKYKYVRGEGVDGGSPSKSFAVPFQKPFELMCLSKYKVVYSTASTSRADLNTASNPGMTIAPKTPIMSSTRPLEPTCSSKYKVVYSSLPAAPRIDSKLTSKPGIMIKSKYSIRTCQLNSAAPTTSFTSGIKKRSMSDFKRISRTKLVRNSLSSGHKLKRKWRRHNVKINDRRFKYVKTKKLSKPIMERNRASSECGSFKSYSRTKLVRTSVLRSQIDARKSTRKFTNASLNAHRLQPLFKSKYKFVREGCAFQKKMTAPISANRLSSSIRIKKRKSLIATMTAKLRKNNQRCLFYNRFGRCKGKDRGTCNKIHDPLYVSVCKKLPFGECTDENCLLSHDIRPGKMPTCYHYLAGMCKRDNCPYLHIKVNPKAPICQSFLHGFCPDVYNCLKRHEYVCPAFAEKGSCPKGKSCAHPHKIPTVHSKLLAEHQRPLMTTRAPPPTSEETADQIESPAQTITNDPVPFFRYFSIPLSSASDPDNDNGVDSVS